MEEPCECETSQAKTVQIKQAPVYYRLWIQQGEYRAKKEQALATTEASDLFDLI